MLSNREFAAAAKLEPQSVRAHLSRCGDYFGLRPTKLPNGRLLWPDDSLDQLAKLGEQRGKSDSAKKSAAEALTKARVVKAAKKLAEAEE